MVMFPTGTDVWLYMARGPLRMGKRDRIQTLRYGVMVVALM